MKYRDEILKPPLRLSAHIMKGKPKMLEKKSQILRNCTPFIPYLCAFGDFYCDFVDRKCPCLIGVN